MEQLFNDIQNLIADNFPQMSLIDEDYGQLEAIETAEDTYPVTFPCVLISPAEVEWSNLGGGSQRGTCIVTVRLAIDCYHDTHYSSTTEDKAIERMKLSTAIHRKLQGFISGKNTELVRKKTINYSRPHAVKVYEHQYSLMINDIVTLPGKV